jgi:hypothetical protein
MWHSENQRIGFQKCSLLAYNLNGLSSLANFITALCCFIFLFLVLRAFVVLDNPNWEMYGVGFVSLMVVYIMNRLVSIYANRMVLQKQFSYDYEKEEAQWIENNVQKKYPTS